LVDIQGRRAARRTSGEKPDLNNTSGLKNLFEVLKVEWDSVDE